LVCDSVNIKFHIIPKSYQYDTDKKGIRVCGTENIVGKKFLTLCGKATQAIFPRNDLYTIVIPPGRLVFDSFDFQYEFLIPKITSDLVHLFFCAVGISAMGNCTAF
jgi:hypothetical protein